MLSPGPAGLSLNSPPFKSANCAPSKLGQLTLLKRRPSHNGQPEMLEFSECGPKISQRHQFVPLFLLAAVLADLFFQDRQPEIMDGVFCIAKG